MLTRRSFIRTGIAAGTGAAYGPLLDRALAATRHKHRRRHSKPHHHKHHHGRPPTLDDIEHVVILMQENRSFDHYFGTLRGVRGFSDPHALFTGGHSVFDQLDLNALANPGMHLLPFHLDSRTTSGQCVADQSHAWAAQQASWAHGDLTGFVLAHEIGNGSGGLATGELCMGYYERADIPFHYALADAFTICDGYHCAVFGPTNPNRIMSMSGTVDPDGVMGGPCLDNGQSNGQLRWTSYPERLDAAGISWFVYQEADNDGNNMLPFFRGVNGAAASSSVAMRANTVIPTPKGAQYGPALAAKLRSDVVSGKLPHVSWVLASTAACEHPSAAPNAGAAFVASVLEALTASRKVWEKTVLFLTYDENDGFFDHVPPPTAPPGTPGEYVDESTALRNLGATLGVAGPVGLGFRVPLLVISPFSHGGMLCSDTFDHTSLLRFLETRFGVHEPNISAWRRETVGDLTSALGCIAKPSYTFPMLPDAVALAAAAKVECDTLRAPTVPKLQRMPVQEPGTRPRAGAACA